MTPSVLDYHADTPTFALAFSPLSTSDATLKLGYGSLAEAPGAQNNLSIIALDPAFLELQDGWDDLAGLGLGGGDDYGAGSARGGGAKARAQPGSSAFQTIARTPHLYPPSAIGFSPARLSNSLQSSNMGSVGEGTREMVGTSSDCLRLFDLVDDGGGAGQSGALAGKGFVGQGRGQGGMRLVSRAVLANTKADYSAPLTSFSWSTIEPTHIVTSSIDTTCTIWDIASGVPITQLIAHDREVYDVAWSPASRDVFASVGADGSVRMFDLRSLEHSTILYEATAPSTSTAVAKKNGSAPPSSTTSTSTTANANGAPLLRLAFSPTAPMYVSVCHADSSDVQILDTRNPGVPVLEVRGHGASVNGMAWRGTDTIGEGSVIPANNNPSGPGTLATCSDDSTLLVWDLEKALPAKAPSSSSSGNRGPQPPPVRIEMPSLHYTAPGEINTVAWGGAGNEWVGFAYGGNGRIRCLRI